MAHSRRAQIHIIRTIILIAYIPCIWSRCSDKAAVSPCTCTVDNRSKMQVSCVGSMTLPRLTTILRKEMCGLEIEQFEFMNSDVDYLPSNLFFKNVVKDIQISSMNISHFTEAGRSAFYGQEPHLKSLSMRRCRLVDNLKWQMIGDLYSLTYLDLSYNGLTRIPRDWFHHPPPSLQSLILKGNRISLLEKGALSNMHTLIELDLSQNKIATIRRDVFPHPGNSLIFLRLNDNELRTLPDDFFHEMMGLRRIYLDNNKLETLVEEVWKPIWGELEHLDLSGNQIKTGNGTFWISELRPPMRLYL